MLRSAIFSADSAVTDVLTFCWSSMRRVAVTVTVLSSPESAAGAAGAVCANAAPAPTKPQVPSASAMARDSVEGTKRDAFIIVFLQARQRGAGLGG